MFMGGGTPRSALVCRTGWVTGSDNVKKSGELVSFFACASCLSNPVR